MIHKSSNHSFRVFRFLSTSEDFPMVVAVNTADADATVDIRQLNPTDDDNAVFAFRSVGSTNPATAPG